MNRWRIVIFVVVVAVGLLAVRVNQGDPPATSQPPAATETFRDYKPVPSNDLVAVAETFTRAYLKGAALPRREWLDGMRPVAAPKLMEGLEATDQGGVPVGEFHVAFIVRQGGGGGFVKVTIKTADGLRDYGVGLTAWPDEPILVSKIEPF